MGLWFLFGLICCLSPRPAENAPTSAEIPLRVMSFNIRYDNPADGENAWSHRRRVVADLIRAQDVDLVGVQEALHHQLLDLQERLPDHTWFGVGRDDGRQAGEFTAIWYRHGRLELIEQGTFWLSETPDKPGLGWDAACPRTVTWGRFRDRFTRSVFVLFNTHFDHYGQEARRAGARLMRRRIGQIVAGDAVVITGDFNTPPDSEPIGILTEAAPDGPRLRDSAAVTTFPRQGPRGTFTGFRNDTPLSEPIDYIFLDENWIVTAHYTLADRPEGQYPSDHLPVLAVLHFVTSERRQ
ncbi:MAG: endonuclease/exonuclease/phosphatase family protein [Acidobacteria bacterium]|nr:endonuclease/exonuclease/phosphatase family protein [Acidobacteriota bacterium]